MQRALGAPHAAPRPRSASHGAGARASAILRLDNAALGFSVILVLLQLSGGAKADVAALAALPLVGLMTYAADRRYLAPLLILCLPALGVIGGRDAIGIPPSLAVPFPFPEAATFVLLGGIEVSAPMVVLAAAFGRVMTEVLRGGRVFRGVIPQWLLAGFMVSLLPALAGGLQGQAQGYNRWSIGMRAMLALAGLFWGVVVARAPSASPPSRLTRPLVAIVVAGSVLWVVGFLKGMLSFVLVGFCGGLLPYLIFRRRIPEAAALAGAGVVFVLMSTLTTAAQALLAAGCVAVAVTRNRALRQWVLRAGVVATGAVSVGLVWLVNELRGQTIIELATREEGLMAYATFKLMGDRGPLWLASIDQIADGPYWVVPSGRSLRPEGFDYGGEVYLWDFGAHNTLLELVRNVGLVAGGAGVVLMAFAVWRTVRVLTDTRDGALRGLAAGFLGASLVSVTTGNYPIFDVGFFIWAMAGMVAGAHLVQQRLDAEAAAAGDDEEDAPEAEAPPPRRLATAAGRWNP